MAIDQQQFEQMIARWSETSEVGDHEEASILGEQILEYVGENADWENDPELQLSAIAAHCEQSGDWEGAEQAYQQQLAMSDNGFGRIRPHWNLASLYDLLDRDDDALHHLRLALAKARSEDSKVTLAMALERVAWALLRKSEFVECEQLLSELIHVLPREKHSEHLRASADILKAAWLVARERYMEAEATLASAHDALQARLFPGAAGIVGELSAWHRVNAELQEQSGNQLQAMDSWKQAVKLARQLDRIPHASDVYSKVTIARRLTQRANYLERTGHPWGAACDRWRARRIRRSLRLPP